MTPEEARLTEEHEGRRDKPYRDSRGILTIGVGHNLEARGLPSEVIDFLLEVDYDAHEAEAMDAFPWLADFDSVRKAAVVDLVFNMGLASVRKFKNTLRSLEQHRWRSAGVGLRQSLWFKQVGKRGPRVVRMIEEGKWPWQA